MILLVSYDLHNPGRDYDTVAEALKAARSWCQLQESVWLLDTRRTPGQWRDRLKASGDSNDEYFVARLSRGWASKSISIAAAAWLKDPARDW